MKEKIAIAIDSGLLAAVDAYVDGSSIRSRSQAIEVLLRQSISQQLITKAVMLLHEKEKGCLFMKVEGKPLIERHLSFLASNGIRELYIIAKKDAALEGISWKGMEIRLVSEEKQKGTASALKLAQPYLTTDFIVFNGDTFNDFDLRKMLAKHKQSKAICTMGLISSDSEQYGSVGLDGDMVVEFSQKAKSHIINAGIYVFKPNVFLLYDESTKSLEKDLFPKLAKISHLQGFFTHGKYYHVPEM